MSRPLVALTAGRMEAFTGVHPATDLFSLDSYYATAVERAGGDAAILPWGDHSEDPLEAARRRLARFDALVLTGGPDIDPARYGAENQGSIDPVDAIDRFNLALVHAAVELGTPVLGICRGQQVVNVALGGTMIQHVWGFSPHHPPRPTGSDQTTDAESFLANRHPVDLDPGSLIHRLAGSDQISVNSLHHQSVDRLGSGMKATGKSPDGIVEATEHQSHPILTVQWHPERLDDEPSHSLFAWLVDMGSDPRPA